MSTYTNRPSGDHNFPCSHRAEEDLEDSRLTSSLAQVSYNIISVFLTPFYCIGLMLKSILSLILNLLKIFFHLIIFWRLPADRRIIETANATNENSFVQTKSKEQHSKLIACPNCEHLHYSTRCCKCRDCVKNTPRLLECFKYHKTGAQVLMCPCIDCKYKRPMSEMCEHCVLLSQKIHVQAKTANDIEVRSRPKPKK